jgi:hypothetical protein
VIAGLTLLAIAMTGAVLLVTDVIYGTGTTLAAAGGAALAFAVLWYVIPLRQLLANR